MDNIINWMKKNNISFEYYGANDLATGIELKSIIDNPSLFDVYEQFPLENVKSFEDYCVFLDYDKFSKYTEMIPILLLDEYKELIKKFCERAKKSVDNVKVDELVNYVSENVKDIFEADSKVFGIKQATIDLIVKYKTGISENCFRWLCERYDYLLLDRFEEFESVFVKYPSLFDKIFKTGHYQEVVCIREETVFNIFVSILKKENSPLKDTVNRVLPILSNDILDMCKNATIENVILVKRTVERFYLCLIKINSSFANSFAKARKQIDELLKESIEKNGQEIKYEIPIEQIIKKWKEQSNWELKIISLTHSWKVLNNGKVRCWSNLEVDGSKKKTLDDIFWINLKKDDYYTMDFQQKLSFLKAVEASIIFNLLVDKRTYVEVMEMLFGEIHFLSEKLDCAEEHLERDIKILDVHLQMTINNDERNQEVDIALCYGASMFLCALIEKILRILYVKLAGVSQYIAIDKVTMGQILTINNGLMKDFFGEKHIRHLAYFLCKDGFKERNIGLDRRNSLAHWRINPDNVDVGLVSELMWLFVDIVNTIFIHFLDIC